MPINCTFVLKDFVKAIVELFFFFFTKVSLIWHSTNYYPLL